MKRGKHKKDKNNGKNGWVSGNPRYKRSKPSRSMTPGVKKIGKIDFSH